MPRIKLLKILTQTLQIKIFLLSASSFFPITVPCIKQLSRGNTEIYNAQSKTLLYSHLTLIFKLRYNNSELHIGRYRLLEDRQMATAQGGLEEYH